MLYTRTESVDRQGRHDGHGRHYQLIVGGLAEPKPGLGPRLSVALCREASLSLVTRQAGCAKPKLDPRPITMEVFGTKDTHTPQWLGWKPQQTTGAGLTALIFTLPHYDAAVAMR